MLPQIIDFSAGCCQHSRTFSLNAPQGGNLGHKSWSLLQELQHIVRAPSSSRSVVVIDDFEVLLDWVFPRSVVLVHQHSLGK
jgi:hypothetical protein